jgi:hypothetical protein
MRKKVSTVTEEDESLGSRGERLPSTSKELYTSCVSDIFLPITVKN